MAVHYQSLQAVTLKDVNTSLAKPNRGTITKSQRADTFVIIWGSSSRISFLFSLVISDKSFKLVTEPSSYEMDDYQYTLKLPL